jgi:hypothetical protein
VGIDSQVSGPAAEARAGKLNAAVTSKGLGVPALLVFVVVLMAVLGWALDVKPNLTGKYPNAFVTWLAYIVLLATFAGAAGYGITGRFSGALIDDRNKMNDSRSGCTQHISGDREHCRARIGWTDSSGAMAWRMGAEHLTRCARVTPRRARRCGSSKRAHDVVPGAGSALILLSGGLTTRSAFSRKRLLSLGGPPQEGMWSQFTSARICRSVDFRARPRQPNQMGMTRPRGGDFH